MTSRDSSFWRFFWRIETTSVPVQAPRASRSISMGPGAELEERSESMGTVWPDGPMARNFSAPIHWMVAVCMESSLGKEKSSREETGEEKAGAYAGVDGSNIRIERAYSIRGLL